MAQRCSCELTLALLERLGGTHARSMRAAGKTKTGEWNAREWLSHIAEEERLFFPLLPPGVRAALLRDHEEIRAKLARPRGKVADRFAAAHAELEDQWAEAIAKRNNWSLHEHRASVKGHPRG